MSRPSAAAAVTVACTFAVLLAAPSAAFADKPHVDPPTSPNPVVCGGAEVVEQLVFDGSKAHELADGSTRFTGGLKVQYTIVGGASVVLNISGPGILTWLPNGDLELRGTGLSGGIDPAGNITHSAGPFWIRVHFGLDGAFTVTDLGGPAPRTWQICPLLT